MGSGDESSIWLEISYQVEIRINREQWSRELAQLKKIIHGSFACVCTATNIKRTLAKDQLFVSTVGVPVLSLCSRKTGSEAAQPQCFNRPPQEGLKERPSEPFGWLLAITYKVSRPYSCVHTFYDSVQLLLLSYADRRIV